MKKNTLTLELEAFDPAPENCPADYRQKSDSERLEAVAKFHGYDSPAEWAAAMVRDVIGDFEDDLIFSPDGEIIGSQSEFVSLEREVASLADEMGN